MKWFFLTLSLVLAFLLLREISEIVNRGQEAITLMGETCEVVLETGDPDRQICDPWGNLLVLSYSENDRCRTATVRSSGPDGKWGTFDDILTSQTTPKK